MLHIDDIDLAIIRYIYENEARGPVNGYDIALKLLPAAKTNNKGKSDFSDVRKLNRKITYRMKNLEKWGLLECEAKNGKKGSNAYFFTLNHTAKSTYPQLLIGDTILSLDVVINPNEPKTKIKMEQGKKIIIVDKEEGKNAIGVLMLDYNL